MKKLALIFASIFLLSSGFAQDEEFKTIFGDDEFSISGYGGPFMSFSTVADEFAHMMGGGGGIILNKTILFGGYGIGKSTRTPINQNKIDVTEFANEYLDGNVSAVSNMELDFGHGGLFAGYVFNGNAPFHPVFIVNFGWGSVAVADNDIQSEYSDNIFVLNPVLEMEMNVTQFFRVGLGANYTLVSGLNMVGYKDADFSSPGVSLSFRFGWF